MDETQVIDPGQAPVAPVKDKRQRPTRVDFPVPEGGFTEWPADWDEKLHRGLLRHSFTDQRVWLRKKIEQANADIARFEAEIAGIGANGQPKRSGSGKLAAVTSQLTDLLEALKAAGIDPEELKKQLAASHG